MSATNRMVSGSVFGRLTVLDPGYGTKYALCRCDCGAERLVRRNHLKSGASQSCGCYASLVTAARSTRHGCARRGARTNEYKIWVGIRRRCLDASDALFPYYGGRGIAMCERWRDSFEAFLSDVGRRPSRAHSIDRIDNNGPYEPGNVRWATRTQQGRNRRNNLRATIDGETRLVIEWCEALGLNYKRVHNRMAHGWSAEDAITRPARRVNGGRNVSNQ